MDWSKIAGKVIAAGAPAIGGALFGPLGGMAGQVLAKALGTEATPEAVEQKIATAAPAQIHAAEQQAIAEFEAMARIAEAEASAQAQIGVANAEQVNETIRATAEGDGLLGKWRGVHAWELTMECFLGFVLFWITAIWAPAANARVLEAIPLLQLYLPARFGVLGVHVFQGSKERQTATKLLPQAASAVAAAVRR